jgi:hypothetical protein
MLLLLPTFVEDRDSDRLAPHRAEIAAAVAAQAPPQGIPRRQWQALILTVASHETHFSIRISDGRCKPWECDRGRAAGMMQIHRNTINAADWGDQAGDVALQVRLGSDALRRAYHTCSRSGVNWVTGALNAYAGRRCGATSSGLALRLATYGRLTR